MNEIAEKLISKLSDSPLDITKKSELKRIHSYLPVPTDFRILWADIGNFGGYPNGVVLTEQAIVFKAPKELVDIENAQRKLSYKEAKKHDKHAKKQGEVSVLYQIVPWDYYESDSYSIKESVDSKGKAYYSLQYGEAELTRFRNSALYKFFLNYAEEERKAKQTSDTISASADFAGVDAAYLENTSFNAGQGVDNSKTGHGKYAEYAGVLLDQISGEKAVHRGDELGENGRYIKDGPDKTVNGIDVQCKYCNTANNSISSCFRKDATTGQKFYRYYDLSGKPMQVEVPKDQYAKAVESMRKHIEKGEVPGVKNPDMAYRLVRKGRITYQQARNLAKAGTFESITFDALSGAVTCTAMCGVSALASFGVVYWQTKDIKRAAGAALRTGIEVFGPSFIGRILAAQLARTALPSMIVPGTKAVVGAMDHQVVRELINAFRTLEGKSAISGAAAQKSLAKVLQTNVIVQASMFLAFSIPDTIRVFNRTVSGAQYTKNMASLAASFVGAAVTSAGAGIAAGKIAEKAGKKVNKKVGAVIGFAGGAVGGTLGSFGAKTIGNLFHEDDATITTRLFNATFSNMSIEFMLQSEEIETVVKKLDQQQKEITKLQRKLIASESQYYDIKQFLEPIILDVVKMRPAIDAHVENQMMEEIDKTVCESADKSDEKDAENEGEE